jgi:predicted O-methyltransferase YrrM
MGRDQSMLNRAAMAMWQRRHPGQSLEHADRESPHLDISVAALPRMAVDRVALRVRNARRTTDEPWITAQALSMLDTMLLPTDRGLEFGSGGSSIWLAQRSGQVISVEAFAQWGDALAKRITDQGIGNLDLELVSAEELGYESDAHRDAYVNVRPELAAESLDWVFVDGEYRDRTALRGLSLLKPGGLFILDNANLFLPTQTRVQWKIDEPATPLWREFLDRVRGWRRVWTTNGAWDTALWIKPL